MLLRKPLAHFGVDLFGFIARQLFDENNTWKLYSPGKLSYFHIKQILLQYCYPQEKGRALRSNT